MVNNIVLVHKIIRRFLIIQFLRLSSISARGGRGAGDPDSRDSDDLRQWGEDENFLVCVHNVSHEIPYAILKVYIHIWN